MKSLARAALFSLLLTGLLAARADEPKADKDKAKEAKEIAGKSEFLRSVPKHFAILKAIDPIRRQVTLLLEGETLPKVWELTHDAEIKRAGFWARLDQLTIGDRVWAWFETNRQQQPIAIFMLCDELSEQDMHGPGVTIEARDTEALTLKPAKGKSRVVKLAKAEVFRGKSAGSLDQLQVSQRVYVQSTGDQARLILDVDAFEARRADQKATLAKRWTDEGLPGSVSVLHRFTGEYELLLDHEAMRWARSLQPGDKVSLPANPPIAAVVRHVRPWRERTLVRLVSAAADLGDLTAGQRIHMKMTAPSTDTDSAALPPDIDRPRATKDERIDWFLASIYCTCKVGGDGCTGHFYSLASCNPNACGMPNQVRRLLADKIDQGKTDRQIYEELLKERGKELIRPHLLP
jgi:hypothetical protein